MPAFRNDRRSIIARCRAFLPWPFCRPAPPGLHSGGSAAAPPEHPGPHRRRSGLHRHRGLRRRDPDPRPGHAGRVGLRFTSFLHRRHLLPDPSDAALRGGPPPGRARGHGEPDGGRPPGPDRLRGVPERARPPPAGGAAGRGGTTLRSPGSGTSARRRTRVPDPRIRPLLRPPHGGGQPLRGRRARGHPRRHSYRARREIVPALRRASIRPAPTPTN